MKKDESKLKAVEQRSIPEEPKPLHPFPKVDICSPLEFEVVGLTVNVRGCADVDDPTLLSLLVQSNNGRWYLQGAPQMNGDIWNADAQFGDPDSPPHDYKIAAVYGSPLVLKSYENIPEGLIVSNIVIVRRTS